MDQQFQVLINNGCGKIIQPGFQQGNLSAVDQGGANRFQVISKELIISELLAGSVGVFIPLMVPVDLYQLNQHGPGLFRSVLTELLLQKVPEEMVVSQPGTAIIDWLDEQVLVKQPLDQIFPVVIPGGITQYFLA